MASDILGENLDIHSGGIDLSFPHHDNEIAQSESHYNCKQWVNYFLHPGHLHIEGQKMSKSLKNFISIKEALEKTTASQLRIMFLLHPWDSVLDYSSGSMTEAKSVESLFLNLLSTIKALVYESKLENNNRHNFHILEKELTIM
jgi:cysteinyl-tRNA synthetase